MRLQARSAQDVPATAPHAGASLPTPAAIGRAATLALHDELALAPKPGLVTPSSPGSHDDMDAHTFMRSLFALRGYFVRIAALGAESAPFVALEAAGLDAEARMHAATGGINTHRGAVFMLGLLCAAAGACSAAGEAPTASRVRDRLRTRWGAVLAARAQRVPTLPGGLADALRRPRPRSASRPCSTPPGRRCRRRARPGCRRRSRGCKRCSR